MSSDPVDGGAHAPGDAHRYWKAAISHLAPEKQAAAWTFYLERMDGATTGAGDTLAGVLLLLEAHLAFFETVPHRLAQASDGITHAAARIEAACDLSSQDTLANGLKERTAAFFAQAVESPLNHGSKTILDAVDRAEGAIVRMTKAAIKTRLLWRVNRLYWATATMVLALGFGVLLSALAWFWLRSRYELSLSARMAALSQVATSNQEAFRSLLISGKELTVRPLHDGGKIVPGKYEMLFAIDAPEQASLIRQDSKLQVHIIFESEFENALRDMHSAASR